MQLRLATRKSKLSLTQSQMMADALMRLNHGLKVDLVHITTTGDKVQDRFLKEVGGKNLFIKELEEAMLQGEADFAVHSLKDVPMTMPAAFCLAAITERVSHEDWLIAADTGFDFEHPILGTSSDRRAVQLMRKYPWAKIKMLRGNVDTRLDKLAAGDYDAIVLAAAGVIRLGLTPAHVQNLDLIASAGQGALGLECLAEREDVKKILSILHDEASFLACSAERAVMRELGGDCHLPLGAYAKLLGDTLNLTAFAASSDGTIYIEDAIIGKKNDAENLGKKLAQQLLNKGADKII